MDQRRAATVGGVGNNSNMRSTVANTTPRIQTLAEVSCRRCGMTQRYDVSVGEVLNWAWVRGWRVDWRTSTTWCPKHADTGPVDG